jgi:hypothetical protein
LAAARRQRQPQPGVVAALALAAVPQRVDVHRRHVEGQVAQHQLGRAPVTRMKCRGSTVSRSEVATTRPAVKNWLTVSTTRRLACPARPAPRR